MGKIYIGNNLLADTKETMLSAASDVGAVFMWGSNTPPKGCLLCDGAAYSRTEYSQLFNVIGTAYGAGDGSATFNLPDMRGRVAVGRDAAQTEFDALNESGGEKTHVLTSAESGIPAHNHPVEFKLGSGVTGIDSTAIQGNTQMFEGVYSQYGTIRTVNNTSANASQAHNNLQPYRVLNFVIRYLPSLNEKTNLSDTLPIATMTEYPSDTIPQNWLLCNGQAVSRTDYAELFAVIGTLYGAGDGSTTFNLPDMRGRVVVGKDSSQAEFDSLNEAGGEKAHTMTVVEIPSHYHEENSRLWRDYDGASFITTASSGGVWMNHEQYGGGPSVNTESTGGGAAHNNLQPYRVVNYIIKAKYTVPVEAVVEDCMTSESAINALSAKQGKALNERIAFLENTPACRAYHNTSQHSNATVYTYLALNSSSTDTDGIHDNSVNNSRLTCKTSGLYMITGNAEFGMTNDSGIRAVLIRKNGMTIIASQVSGMVPLSIGYITGTVTTVAEMYVGDYVELGIAQTSGTELTIGQSIATTFSMIKIA